jgi:single-stranded DNA-binding protein
MNKIFITGDVTGDIHFDTIRKDGKVVAFLRMMAVVQSSSMESPIPPIRFVAYGRVAEIIEGFVLRGTRLFVEGRLQVRRHKAQVVHEIVCEKAQAIRYADWDRGLKRIEELKAKDAELFHSHGDLIEGLRNKEAEGLPNPALDIKALPQPDEELATKMPEPAMAR